MNILIRLINRIRFRKSIKTDESINVVDSLAKAHKLYRELARKAHPDCNPTCREVAAALMQRIVENKNNYAELLKLKDEVATKIQHNTNL